MLETWANANYLSYLLRLIHRNKPDFLLRYGQREVGVEFTEAISEEMAETRALAEHIGEKVTLSMDHFKRGTPKRTAAGRRQIIRTQPVVPGWADEEAEHEWALSIMESVLAKTKDFDKPGFKKYDRNWLLIYDNLSVQLEEIEEIQNAIGYLRAALNSYWVKKNRYDGVLVEIRNQLIEIQPLQWNQQPLIYLWT